MKNPVTVERSGTWPILKYTIRGDGVGYCSVFIDDSFGDIVINSGDQIALKHFWGKSGRGAEKLREFLVKVDKGYLEDKFSYGLTRWYADVALQDLHDLLEKELGSEHAWSPEIVEEYEGLRGNFNDSGGFYHLISAATEIQKVIDIYDEPPSGESSCNRDVGRFVAQVWPHLKELWKKELAEEAVNATQSI